MDNWPAYTRYTTLLNLCRAGDRSIPACADHLKKILQYCLPSGSMYQFVVCVNGTSRGEQLSAVLLIGFNHQCKWTEWMSDSFGISADIDNASAVWLGYGRAALDALWSERADVRPGWGTQFTKEEPETKTWLSTSTQTTNNYFNVTSHEWVKGTSDAMAFVENSLHYIKHQVSSEDPAEYVSGTK